MDLSNLKKPSEILKAQNFVDGEWVSGSGPKVDVISPYFGDVLGEFNEASSIDLDHIVSAAVKAQEKWAATPLKERTRILFNFREILLARKTEISPIISLESGKTVAEAEAGLMKGIEVLEFALSLQNSDDGARMQVSRGVFCEYRREPLGVVASITPFNFPAMVPMWTIPIALVLGNAYVWKPSDKTPLTSIFLANALKDAGIPNGVFSVVQGGVDSVNSLIDHSDVKAVAFVGSSRVAKLVYQRGSNLGKRVLALGGAKNHIVLLPDADPEISGPGISDSFTGCAGQRCMAASVLLAVGGESGVDFDRTERQIEKIIERAKSIELGRTMGAIITKEQRDFLFEAIGRAEKAGAKVLLDGREAKPPKEYAVGFWIGPTILDHVSEGSEALVDELFGPILSIKRCSSITEAMKIENANVYGNACSVFTSSGALAEKVISSARAGMVGINIGVPVPREPFSFGGIAASKFGHGDITGPASLNFWSDLKKVTTKWENQSDANWMS